MLFAPNVPLQGPWRKKNIKKHTKSEHPFQKSIKKHCDRGGTDDFERVFASAPKRFSKTSEPLRFASKKCFKKRRFFEQKLAKYFAPSAVRTFLGTLREVPKWWAKLKKKKSWRTPKSTLLSTILLNTDLAKRTKICQQLCALGGTEVFRNALGSLKTVTPIKQKSRWADTKIYILSVILPNADTSKHTLNIWKFK